MMASLGMLKNKGNDGGKVNAPQWRKRAYIHKTDTAGRQEDTQTGDENSRNLQKLCETGS